MKKKIKNLRFFIFYVIFSVFLQGNAFSLSYSDLQSSLLDNEFFQLFFNSNEGTSSFRSLLIPVGGRSESLASSYTGLFDDISFINYNPAASSIQKETQFAIFHNSWIADSALETISYTSRNKNLGYAAQLSCFHVPFTEYNAFGKKVNASYYSETVANLNLSSSYNPTVPFIKTVFVLSIILLYSSKVFLPMSNILSSFSISFNSLYFLLLLFST